MELPPMDKPSHFSMALDDCRAQSTALLQYECAALKTHIHDLNLENTEKRLYFCCVNVQKAAGAWVPPNTDRLLSL